MRSLSVLKSWKKLSKRRRARITIVATAVAATSIWIGWYAGRAVSPDLNTEQAAQRFLLLNFHADSIGRDDVKLHLRAGYRTFYYRLSSNKLDESLPPPQLMASLPLPRHDLFKDADKYFGILGITAAPAGLASLWRDAWVVTRQTKGVALVAAAMFVISFGTGGAIGFWLGYDDRMDFEGERFLKTLRDRANWQRLASSLSQCVTTLHGGNAGSALQSVYAGDPAQNEELRYETREKCRELLSWSIERTPETVENN